jgi:hypothetical protein
VTVPGLDVPVLPPFEIFCGDVLGLDMSSRWAAMLIHKAFDGRPLDAAETAAFCTYTGRSAYAPPPGGFPQLLALVGRQAGKTESAAARMTYQAASASLAGERNVAVIGVAQDSRASIRVLFGYVLRFFESPLLAPLVVSRTADSLTLQGGVLITVLPCRPAALRGLRCRFVVLDEIAHFRSSENLPLDRDTWRAALPSLLTTRGKLLALSSPWAASGLAYDLHKAHYGRDDSPLLVWQSPGTVLHPTLDAGFMAHLREIDPDSARAELDGEFLSNVSALLDEAVIEAAVELGLTVRPPEHGPSYLAFVDVATGSKAGGDATALAIAHRDAAGVAVLDVVRAWRPPFNPGEVAQHMAALCRQYRVSTVTGDRFAQGFSDELLRQAGLRSRPSERDKSAIYVDLAAVLNAGQARLLDVPELLRELRGLERRRGATKDRVDCWRGHDDVANAAAGALTLAVRPQRTTFAMVNSNDAFAHLHL